jgi:3-phosphoshikimate 1-carboxyvinyltransferase
MTIQIYPSNINGKQIAPASKSSMQRACAAALLHQGKTIIHNAGISNDDKAALNIITQLGASIHQHANTIEVVSNGFGKNTQANNVQINCGESGLSIRMFTPIAALASSTIEIIGQGSLLTRPMNFFDEIFPELGIKIASNNGKLPLQVTGPLQAQHITIDGSLSSQFLTGLLFSFAEAAVEPIKINVIALKSKPYIDLTLHVMKHFGYNISHTNHQVFDILPKSKPQNTIINYTVEGDWSSASFLLVAAAIVGNISITGLNVHSTQADKAILDVLKLAGAKIIITENEIEISKAILKPFEFDATHCPDLFPPIVALASYCNGTSVIKGVHRLAAKESDRGLTLQDVFGKMGIQILLENDEMKIIGGPILSATVSSHHDHRIAMAAAVAALGANDCITITEADAINKSYPQFYNDISSLGASTKILNS